MPNWCTNRTYVFGKKDVVLSFHNAILDASQQEDFRGFMHLFDPIPSELLNTKSTFMDLENPVHENWVNLVADGTWTQEYYDERAAEAIADAEVYKSNIAKYGFKDWYDWCIATWGSKWGDCDLDFSITSHSDDTATVELFYETAWSPITEGLERLSAKYKRMIFTTFYSEEGMGFQGYHKTANGEVLVDQSAEFIPRAEDYYYIMDSEDEKEIEGLIK